MKIYRKCPMCGQVKNIEVADKLELAIDRYEMGIGYIQDIPLPASEREFIKTGYCIDCQDILFAPPEEEEECESENY
jgi:hypothetical protein